MFLLQSQSDDQIFSLLSLASSLTSSFLLSRCAKRFRAELSTTKSFPTRMRVSRHEFICFLQTSDQVAASGWVVILCSTVNSRIDCIGLLESSNKKLLVTSASLVVTSALLVVTRSY